MAEESFVDVRALSDDELKALEDSMSRNLCTTHISDLRNAIREPETDFELRYVNICKELKHRGLLDVY